MQPVAHVDGFAIVGVAVEDGDELGDLAVDVGFVAF
jgi:hypothetical protein